MKEGWTYKKLGEVCDTINGLWKGKKPPFVNIGVIRNANFTKDFTLRFDNVEYLDVEERQYVKRKLQKGDLIIEKSGGSEKQPVGRAVLFDKEDGDFSFSNFTSVLRIKDKNELLSEFLFIYLLYVYRRGDTLKMQKATTGIHNIEFDKYLNIDIPDIPLSEQHSIVARLDAAFAGIDALKANAERQLAEARALFNRALTEEMTPKEGWEERPFEGCINKIPKQKQVKSKDYKTYGSFPIVSQEKDLICGYWDDESYLYKHDKPIIIFGDHTKEIKYIDFDFVVGADGTQLLSPKDDINTRFFYFALLNTHIRTLEYARHFKLLKEKMFFIPPINVQLSIVARLDALSANIKKLEEVQRKTLAECDALKQAMLREVFE